MNPDKMSELAESNRRALIIANVLRHDQIPVHAYVRYLSERIELEFIVFHESMYRLGHAAAWRDEIAALKHIWGDETGEEAFAVALYALVCRPNDPYLCAAQWGKRAALAVIIVEQLSQ